MKRLAVIGSAVLACAGLIWAGVNVDVNIRVGGPRIVFAKRPAVVLAAPGIYVIPDSPEEVFFVSGYYWTAHHGNWYRCSGHRGKWVRIHRRHVPAIIISVPAGKYRNWHPADEEIEEPAEPVVEEQAVSAPAEEPLKEQEPGKVSQEKTNLNSYEND